MFHNTAPARAVILEWQSSMYPKEKNVMLGKGASVPYTSAEIDKNIGAFQMKLLRNQIKELRSQMRQLRKQIKELRSACLLQEKLYCLQNSEVEEKIPKGRECEKNAMSTAFRRNMIYLLGCLGVNKGHNLAI